MATPNLDKQMRRLSQRMEKIYKLLDGQQAVVGVQGAAARATKPGTSTSALKVASVHEFGSLDGSIPERSYLRSTVKEQRKKHRAMIDRAVLRAIKARRAPDLRKVGLAAVNDVKMKIRSFIAPVLKESTIRRKTKQGKRKETPLINTGQLINSITSKIEQIND